MKSCQKEDPKIIAGILVESCFLDQNQACAQCIKTRFCLKSDVDLCSIDLKNILELLEYESKGVTG